jgi:hypothetical protein
MSNRDASAEAIIGLSAKSGTAMEHTTTNVGYSVAIVGSSPFAIDSISTNVGDSVAIGDNSPFAIDHAATNEIENTKEATNVEVGGDNHVDDGNESIVSDDGTENDQVSDAAIPWPTR